MMVILANLSHVGDDNDTIYDITLIERNFWIWMHLLFK